MRAVRFFVILAMCLLAQDVYAKPDRVAAMFRGEIIVLQAPPPTRFASDALFVKFLKTKRLKELWPDKKNNKQWKMEYMAFFKEAPTDVEVKMKIFDVTEGRKFVQGDSVYLSQRGQRILSSNLVLEQPPFDVNRKYILYLTNSRNVVLASATFWLRGKGETHSGKVDFSDDEAAGR